MKAFKLVAAAAAIAGATALAGASAEAAHFSLVDGTAGTIPDAGQVNEVLSGLGLGGSLAGYFGAQINLVGTSRVTVEFLGYEAGYRNTFALGGGSFSTELDDPTPGNNREIFTTPPSFYTGPLSGLIPFVFATSGGTPGSAVNGSNPTDASEGPTGVNFFASFVGAPTATSGRSLMLFFDDNGGNNDDDHDDMVVRLSVAPVPVPASLPLLLGALAGIGFISRRKRARATA